MTNTMFGVLFLMAVFIIISLYSCNRNNSKSEINNKNELKDTTNVSTVNADTVSDKMDTLQADMAQTDSIQVDTLAASKANKVIPGEKLITDDVEEISTAPAIKETEGTLTETLSLKDNINKPKTGEGSGIKATGAIKDRKNNTSKRILFVGSGGGVTGAVNEYTIDVDGSMYEKKSLGETASRKKGLKTNQIQQINDMFNALDFDQMKYNNPGNLYYFIGYEINGKRHQITWGGANDEVPQKVKAYYDFMMNELSN